MPDAQFTVDNFRKLALEGFGFLEAKGFRRMQRLEEASPTSGTLVYMGEHVGFVFSLDLRDKCVDALVVKVLGGQLRPNLQDGYSSNVFSHLVKYQHYRGRSAQSRAAISDDSGTTTLQEMINGLADLLKLFGRSLLDDNERSLP